MLVLSRGVFESILIGGNIRVTVCRIGPGQVWIGIDAPPDVPIVRTELIDGSGGNSQSHGHDGSQNHDRTHAHTGAHDRPRGRDDGQRKPPRRR